MRHCSAFADAWDQLHAIQFEEAVLARSQQAARFSAEAQGAVSRTFRSPPAQAKPKPKPARPLEARPAHNARLSSTCAYLAAAPFTPASQLTGSGAMPFTRGRTSHHSNKGAHGGVAMDMSQGGRIQAPAARALDAEAALHKAQLVALRGAMRSRSKTQVGPPAAQSPPSRSTHAATLRHLPATAGSSQRTGTLKSEIRPIGSKWATNRPTGGLWGAPRPSQWAAWNAQFASAHAARGRGFSPDRGRDKQAAQAHGSAAMPQTPQARSAMAQSFAMPSTAPGHAGAATGFSTVRGGCAVHNHPMRSRSLAEHEPEAQPQAQSHKQRGYGFSKIIGSKNKQHDGSPPSEPSSPIAAAWERSSALPPSAAVPRTAPQRNAATQQRSSSLLHAASLSAAHAAIAPVTVHVGGPHRPTKAPRIGLTITHTSPSRQGGTLLSTQQRSLPVRTSQDGAAMVGVPGAAAPANAPAHPDACSQSPHAQQLEEPTASASLSVASVTGHQRSDTPTEPARGDASEGAAGAAGAEKSPSQRELSLTGLQRGSSAQEALEPADPHVRTRDSSCAASEAVASEQDQKPGHSATAQPAMAPFAAQPIVSVQETSHTPGQQRDSEEHTARVGADALPQLDHGSTTGAHVQHSQSAGGDCDAMPTIAAGQADEDAIMRAASDAASAASSAMQFAGNLQGDKHLAEASVRKGKEKRFEWADENAGAAFDFGDNHANSEEDWLKERGHGDHIDDDEDIDEDTDIYEHAGSDHDQEEQEEGDADEAIAEDHENDCVIGGVRVLNKKYHVEKMVGEGAYGKVLRCSVAGAPGELVAVKAFKISDHDADAEDVKRTAHREAALLRRLAHRHVVACTNAFLVHDRLYIVMEFMPMTLLDLLEATNGGRGLDGGAIRRVVYQLVKVMAFIHAQARRRCCACLKRLLLAGANPVRRCWACLQLAPCQQHCKTTTGT
jgi:Protein kinase domain